MDELLQFNQERWEALAQAGIAYARPMLDLDVEAARALVDPYGFLGDVAGKEVLCLAASGGQQSAAFALLGARVTVIDFSATQLARDRLAAEHYGVTVHTVQGDIRDLSAFADGGFAVVWQAHSLNFVPDAAPVFDGVARVLCPGGFYRLDCSNPFVMGADEAWTGAGYALTRPYVDGARLAFEDSAWEFEDAEGQVQRVEGPHEFRHTLGSLLNGLIGRGFALLGLWEYPAGDAGAEPGTWEHYKAIAPPFLEFWTVYRPALGLPTPARGASRERTEAQ